MRLIGFIPDPVDAKVFENYLITKNIETKLDRVGSGWKIWVINEDLLSCAKDELASFLNNSSAGIYVDAQPKALNILQEKETQEQNSRYLEVPLVQVPGAPKVTIFLLLATIAMGLPGLFGEEYLEKMVKNFGIQGENSAGFQLAEVKSGEVWRLITPVFLHFGPLHLIFNCLLLKQFGEMIELARGAGRFFLLWLLLCVATNIAQFYLGAIGLEQGKLMLFQPKIFGGMSGVIYGFVGYSWMKSEFQPSLGIGVPKGMLNFLLIWLVICWTGLLGPVANISHTSGLVCGIILGLIPQKFSL